ncbi:MAG: DNA polymerase III subunit delta [Clostridia bacterium]|nr:DNA polymerase III subunit delta [Clostridia bacterium]
MAKKGDNTIGASELAKQVMSGEIKNVYLFYGEEEYLKSFFTKSVLARIGASRESVTWFDGKVSPVDLSAALDVSPLLAEVTAVVVRDSGIFKGSSRTQDFSFLAELEGDSFAIFRETDVDRSNGNFKAVESAGMAIMCGEQPDSEITRLLARKAGSLGRQISTGAVAQLIRGKGRDLYMLVNEVDRLSFLVEEGGMIDENTVRSATELSPEARIYEFTDAVAEKKPEAAYEKYYSLLAEKEPPQRLLVSLAYHFRGLYNVAVLSEKGMNTAGMAAELKLQEFIVRKYLKQCKIYTRDALGDIVGFIADVDIRGKSGLMGAEDMVEVVISYVNSQ